MQTTPVEKVTALTIGTVESVSPSEIKVLLETDAPQATALNTGVPTGFPRINGYLLIPNEVGAVVGLIVWLGVERSAFPKRTGMKDFGLIDLPFPLRKLALTPLGTLIKKKEEDVHSYHYRLERGVLAFPSVGDPVLLPTAEQLKCIVEAGEEIDRRVVIGTSPMAADAKIAVDPNKIFGRHLAVLGNTGSGKSCSVAGLIRWSLEKAERVRKDILSAKLKKAKAKKDESAIEEARKKHETPVNARFIILDPNGEYSTAFADFLRDKKARVFRVPPVDDSFRELVLPAWMWNSHEWCSFAHAAPGVQRPILLQALRDMRSGQVLSEPVEHRVNRLFRSYKSMLEGKIAQGVGGYTGTREASECGRLLSNIADDAESYVSKTEGDLSSRLEGLTTTADRIANEKHWDGNRHRTNKGYNAFSESNIREVLKEIDSVLGTLSLDPTFLPISEDAPIPFEVNALPDHLEKIASDAPSGQAAQFVATLSMRIRMMLADQRLGPVVNPASSRSISFDMWLADYIGDDGSENGQLAILDLSLVPSDVLHIVIAVVARIVFEAIQRYHRLNGKELPTVLVLEEAHTFIRKGGDQEEAIPTPAQMCRRTFERIAREGRKFGLGLVLSSQRPSELSPTALAQCNTFLLHRIVNDRDQDLVSRLVPDNLGGLLKELPSLPSRQAILLGWAVPVPVLVEITELSEEQRPKSSDPEFWKVWTGEVDRPVDWKKVADDWIGGEHRTEETTGSNGKAGTEEDVE